MKRVLLLLYLTLIFVLPAGTSFGSTKVAGVTEHLGSKIPLKVDFKDAAGRTVSLKDIINKPTVIDFCYYRCTGICTPLMVEVAEVIGKVDLEPGKDYDVISLSISPEEKPSDAARKKNSMMGLISKKVPPDSWKFLTGDSTNIYKISDAAGFNFVRQGNGYLHKGVLIFVDKNGKICQYLHPGYNSKGDFSILPSDFKMAILSTSKGDVISTIASALQTCFTFRPKGRDILVFSLIFAVGLITVSTVLIIIKKANPQKGNRK